MAKHYWGCFNTIFIAMQPLESRLLWAVCNIYTSVNHSLYGRSNANNFYSKMNEGKASSLREAQMIEKLTWPDLNETVTTLGQSQFKGLLILLKLLHPISESRPNP